MKISLPLFIIAFIIVILLSTVFLYNVYIKNLVPGTPKILWLYWDSEELPHTIQLIKNHNEKTIKGWDIRYLNNKTIDDYIPRSAYHKNYNALVPQNQSDWIRLYIVYNYGGCWLDMGIIINDSKALNKIYEKSLKTGSEMTVFKTVKKNGYFTHESGKKLPLVVDSWFICAPKKSGVIKNWLQEFTNAMDEGFLNYKRRVISEGVDISKIHFANEEDTYLMVHICIQYLLQKKRLPKVTFLDSGKSMLKLQNICKWDNRCLADKLNNDPESKELPFIKLTGYNRKENIDRFFE